jgi:uncharacterized membrane protein (DUF2068 family)
MRRTEPALQLIIGYKLARAAVALAASGLLVVLTATGHAVALDELAERLRHHVTSAWSIVLADQLVRAVVPRHLWMLASALALDGTFTFVEGCSLWRRWWWGPWLIVVTTAAFVPVEVLALVRHLAWARAILLALNLVVALYLGRRALLRTVAAAPAAGGTQAAPRDATIPRRPR